MHTIVRGSFIEGMLGVYVSLGVSLVHLRGVPYLITLEVSCAWGGIP